MWTSESVGWVVTHKKRMSSAERETSAISGKKNLLEANIKSHGSFFKEFEQMCADYGVQLVAKNEMFGVADILGPLEKCKALKQELEERGLADMRENTFKGTPWGAV